MKKSAIYLRVSTNTQETENQRRQLEQFIQSKEWDLVKTYEDVVSGRDPSKLEFNQMLHDARVRKWDVLMFWAWDRLTRRGIEATFDIMRKLQGCGVAWESIKEPFLSSASDPHIRELILSIMAWIAKQESERDSERTKAGMERARGKGKHIGRPKGKKDKKPRKRRWKKKPVEVE